MSEWVKDLFIAIVSILVSKYFFEWYNRYLNRTKLATDQVNAELQGHKMNIEIKTNIDELLRVHTTNLQNEIKKREAEIEELDNMIIDMNRERIKDREKYAGQIAIIEKKLDFQIERNEMLVDQLQKEISIRADCFKRLQEFSEKYSLPFPPKI